MVLLYSKQDINCCSKLRSGFIVGKNRRKNKEIICKFFFACIIGKHN